MKYIRIILYISILSAYCWLTWWVLPDFAFIHLLGKKEQIPDSGLILFGFEKAMYTGHRVISSINYGWSTLWAAWPCTIAGGLFGLGIGHIGGEITRRTFAIELASEEAVRLAKKHESNGDSSCANVEKLLQKLEHDVLQFESEKRGLEFQRLELLLEKKLFKDGVRKFESGELNKAKSTISRLEKKIKRLQEKPVDANQIQG